MHILAEITPLDPVAGTRPTLRVSSLQDRNVNGLNGVKWWPGITRKPSMGITLFDGDFSSGVNSGQISMEIAVTALEKLDANARRFVWAGASITVYSGTTGQAWPWTKIFVGRVEGFRVQANKLSLSATVDEEPFQAKVLSATYAGTGGLEGGADIKGKPKPWAFGAPKNIEPVLIDSINSVFQVSAYGTIKAVTTLYERGAAFSASFGNYADYTALVAASIPAGRWATCLASGLIRLGAPPYGVITADIEGDYLSSTWRRLPGAILQRICSALSISGGLIDTTSLNTLDSALAALPAGGNINLYLTEQQEVIDLARDIAISCNAQAGVSWLGQLFTTRVAISSPVASLDAQAKSMPRVVSNVEIQVSPPYTRIQMGGDKCWRVQSFDEIAFQAELIDKGLYSASVVYRDGNIVSLDDGSRWLFVGAQPLSNSAPNDANGNWSRMTNAAVASIPLGSNLVVNSEFTNGLTGWSVGWDGNTGLPVTRGLDLAGYFGTKHVAWATATGTPAAGTVFDAYYAMGPGTGNLDTARKWAVPVLPGERLYYSALVAGHRCSVLANLQYWDANGTYLTEVASAGTPFTGAPTFANGDPANATRVGAFHTVPSGARFAFLNIRAVCPGGQANPYIFFSDGFIAKVDPAQTAVPPYTMGPGDRRATEGAPSGTLVAGVSADTVAAATTNFNASNDRNNAAVTAPTIATDGTAVDHTLQSNGSADISFEWSWGGTEGDIDGFLVYLYQSSSASAYTFGTTPAAETVFTLPANKRAFILFGTAPDQYYSFAVQAYRSVDKDINAAGAIKSTLVKATGSGENPYRPSASVAFGGNVTGTVAGIAAANVNVWAQISGTGKPADNATRNVVTYSSSAPVSPVDGDLWVDTSGTFAVFKLRSGGAWVTGANALSAYNTLSGKPVALADINTTESSKLAGIAAGATVGAPAGTNVGSTPAATVESGANAANAGVNSDGTIKTDKVGTDAVVDAAITDMDVASNGTTFYPAGGVSFPTYDSYTVSAWQNMLSYTLVLARAAKVQVQGVWRQTYSASHADAAAELLVNGVVVDNYWGSAPNDKPLLLAKVDLAAGSHTILLRWQGNSGVGAFRPRIPVLWRYK